MKKLFFILLSIQVLFALDVQELKKGDVIEDNIQRLEKKYYKVGIADLKNIRVSVNNLSDDVDIYVKSEHLDDLESNKPIEDIVPTMRRHDCYSANSKRENEECYFQIHSPIPSAEDINVYILVYGFKAASYRLEVKEEAAEKIDILSEKSMQGEVKKGESKQYRISGKAGQTIEAKIFNLTADADLRMKFGKKAGLHTFDCKSTNGSTKADSCSITLEKSGTVYVQVYGYRAANFSITGAVVNNESQLLITKAKEQCLNQDKSTDKILCAKENNKVYLMEYNEEYADDVIHIVSTQNEWSVLGEQVISYLGYAGRASLHKLKDTELFYVVSKTSRSTFFDFYYFNDTDKKLVKAFSESLTTDTFEIDSLKTIENGEKLVMEYHHKGSGDKFTRVHDISNL
jgi:hypothetical protein